MIDKKAIGVGLRIPHYPYIFENKPKVDFFEIISENFMGVQGMPRKNLEKILVDYPVALHGTSMGIASRDPLNFKYLDSLKELCQLTNTPYFTDHLCWSHAHGVHYHDLLPIPYTKDNAKYIAEKVKIVQDYIGLPFGLENLSSYVEFTESEMTEWEFYNLVVEMSGAYYMLDFNNIYVSSKNQNFNPHEYVDSIDYSKVLQCHVAGHTVKEEGYILDTHDHHVNDYVWSLYKQGWAQSQGFPTLLEWDGNFLSFEETHAEALKAKAYQGELKPAANKSNTNIPSSPSSEHQISEGKKAEEPAHTNKILSVKQTKEDQTDLELPTRSAPPETLDKLETKFGDTLRLPMSTANKRLSPDVKNFSGSLEKLIEPGFKKSGKGMISIYNEQYWFRLLTVLQENHPLLRHMLTVWKFNHLAMDYLSLYPSTNPSLNHLSDSMLEFMQNPKNEWSSPFSCEAVQLENWYRETKMMDPLPALSFEKPTEDDLNHLMENDIHFQPSFTLFKESWNALECFFKVYQDKDDKVALEMKKQTSYWGLLRIEGKTTPIYLSKLQYQLLHTLMKKKKLEATLDELIASLDENEVAELKEDVYKWFGGWALKGVFAQEHVREYVD